MAKPKTDDRLFDSEEKEVYKKDLKETMKRYRKHLRLMVKAEEAGKRGAEAVESEKKKKPKKTHLGLASMDKVKEAINPTEKIYKEGGKVQKEYAHSAIDKLINNN